MSQLDFFGGPRDLDVVAAAPPNPAHALIAAALPDELRLGGMSWSYAGWRSLVYDARAPLTQLPAHGLAAYAAHPLLRAVEIDHTFYTAVSADALARFGRQVPDDFRFVVKAHQDVTTLVYPRHARFGARQGQRNPLFLDVEHALAHVVEPLLAGLADRASLLLQFSPFETIRAPERFAELLHTFLRRLPPALRVVVELRNEALLTPAYGAVLADVGAAHCYTRWSFMPSLLAQKRLVPAGDATGLFVRWLCRAGDSHADAEARFLPFDRVREPDFETRRELVALCAESRAPSRTVLVSNNAEGCAPETVAALAAALKT
jgi:uncharacterized protein YecE (DUF72 family)